MKWFWNRKKKRKRKHLPQINKKSYNEMEWLLLHDEVTIHGRAFLLDHKRVKRKDHQRYIA